MVRLAVVLLAAMMLLSPATGSALPAKPGEKTISVEEPTAIAGKNLPAAGLRIVADPVEQAKAERLREIAVFELDRLSRELGLPPPPLVTIDLARTERLFFRKTGGRAPHWGAGVAFPRHGYIVLNSEKLDAGERAFPETISHELTHVLLGWNTPPPGPPAWFDEGLAMFEAGEWHLGESYLVARAVIFDTLIPLYKLEGRFPSSETTARLAYTESYTAVALIAETHSRGALRQICASLAAGESFENALKNATGWNRQEFEYIWGDHLRMRYRWMYLLTDTSLLWGFMALLVLGGFASRLLRKRKRLGRMAEEEAEFYRERRFDG